MVITILLGAMAAVFIAFNLFEKKETYGVISYKSIALSITYVILAVIVGSFLDNINTIFQGFHDRDRKSTRLNSSHVSISYAVFCLKKKKNDRAHTNTKI